MLCFLGDRCETGKLGGWGNLGDGYSRRMICASLSADLEIIRFLSVFIQPNHFLATMENAYYTILTEYHTPSSTTTVECLRSTQP